MDSYKKIKGATELLNEVHQMSHDKAYALRDYFNALVDCDWPEVVERMVDARKRGSDHAFSGVRWDLKADRIRKQYREYKEMRRLEDENLC